MASLKLNPQAKTKPLGTLGCNRDPPPKQRNPFGKQETSPRPLNLPQGTIHPLLNRA